VREEFFFCKITITFFFHFRRSFAKEKERQGKKLSFNHPSRNTPFGYRGHLNSRTKLINQLLCSSI